MGNGYGTSPTRPRNIRQGRARPSSCLPLSRRLSRAPPTPLQPARPARTTLTTSRHRPRQLSLRSTLFHRPHFRRPTLARDRRARANRPRLRLRSPQPISPRLSSTTNRSSTTTALSSLHSQASDLGSLHPQLTTRAHRRCGRRARWRERWGLARVARVSRR